MKPFVRKAAAIFHLPSRHLLWFAPSLLFIAALMVVLTFACPLPIVAQDLASQRGGSDKAAGAAPVVATRPCGTGATVHGRKQKRAGKSAARAKDAVPACLEAKGSPLEIQEFFQSYARVQVWRVGDERIVADGWVFVRYLDQDELLQFAKEGLFAGRVRWSEGRALIQVTTHELEGGFTRVDVSARFQGNGQNVDRFAPPKNTWDLDSSGALEKLLIEALDAHQKSIH